MAHKKLLTKEKKNNLLGWLSIVLLVIIFPLGLFLSPYLMGLVGYNYITSEGSRIGQIYKLSNKGLIWKTWEGSMGLTQSGAYAEVWDFSVDSDSFNKDKLINQIKDAYQTGTIVRVQYKEHFGILPWRGKTEYTIEDIEVVRIR